MKKLTIIFLFGLLGQANAQVSNGQVYLLTDRLFDACTVDARCDCCASQLIFISDKVFVFINYCESDGSYWTGTYLVKQNKVILNFKQIEVTDTYDFEKKQKHFERENKKIESYEFEIASCGQGKVILKNYKLESIKYGERLSAKNSEATITQYKNSEPWKLLMK